MDPPPDLLGLSNRVYVQGHQVGLASYHFGSLLNDDESEKPYIFYDDVPPHWRLDNGNAPPSKKYFENWSYDEAERIFRGEITWFPATFGGDAKWVYEMHFSEDFGVISGGSCKAFGLEGDEQGEHKFGDVLVYRFYEFSVPGFASAA